jgi:hypothetical protein
MLLEFPMFTLASQFNISYAFNVTNAGMNCTQFYENILLWPTTTSASLCSDPSGTFNFQNNSTDFQGYIKTSIALTSIYLYSNKYNTAEADYFDTFTALTGWSSFQISQYITSPGSMMTYFVTSELQTPVYDWYSTIDGDICDSTVITGCSFSNLTYN